MPKSKPSTRPKGAPLGCVANLWRAADRLRSRIDVAEYPYVSMNKAASIFFSSNRQSQR
jgi:hypothetical protein